MQVLKKGREQKGWSKEFICTGKGYYEGGCGAMLLVSAEDVTCMHLSCMGESSGTKFSFECPECGVQTEIEEYVPGAKRRS